MLFTPAREPRRAGPPKCASVGDVQLPEPRDCVMYEVLATETISTAINRIFQLYPAGDVTENENGGSNGYTILVTPVL